MIDKINGFKAAITACIAAATALWGWFGWMIVVWIACMAIDYGTGYGAAMKNGEWSSDIARDGRWHKVGCLIAAGVAGILDIVVGYMLRNIPGVTLPFRYSVLFSPLVVSWYIMMEMGSILENVGRLGAPMPAFLRQAIKVLKGTIDVAGESAAEEKSE